MVKYKIEVDRDKCIGCGTCVSLCGENFELHEGKSRPKKSVVTDLSCNQEAADNCPVGAIKVTKTK